MTRSKTDYVLLESLAPKLERWCADNGLECVQCSKWQWNVKEPVQNILISVYPGSRIMWVAKAHYNNSDITDKSNTSIYFADYSSMIACLEKVIFAGDFV